MALELMHYLKNKLQACYSFLKSFILTRHLKSREERQHDARCEITCDLSDERTFFAWQRNHMANERTFLAWCRTGIALIVFSFVIERFDLLIRELTFFSKSPNLYSYTARTHYAGIAVFALGAAIILLAGWRFFYIRRHINKGDIEFSTLPDVFLMSSVLVTVLMTFILFAFLF